MNVLLLHGIFDSGRIFAPMSAALHRDGHRCFAPSFVPADARAGLAPLAEFVAQYVQEELPPDQPFALVGFSMGGIVARYYLQHLGGMARARALVTISSPHSGSVWGYFYPGQGTRDLRPHSALLQGLQASESMLAGLPVHNYWTSFDLTVLPAKHCRWSRAQSEQDVRGLWHRWMVRHPQVVAGVRQQLAALEEASA
ncbi:MAG: alpha/beta fold hydrolase [Pseudomonadota bacterium]